MSVASFTCDLLRTAPIEGRAKLGKQISKFVWQIGIKS